jgi:hypothetical protein
MRAWQPKKLRDRGFFATAFRHPKFVSNQLVVRGRARRGARAASARGDELNPRAAERKNGLRIALLGALARSDRCQSAPSSLTSI